MHVQTRLTWLIWTIYLVAICLLIAMHGFDRTVLFHYLNACKHWWAHERIYYSAYHGFDYLPQSALLMTPFAFFPFPVTEILWRIFSIGIFAFAVRCFTSLAKQHADKYFLITTLVSLPICFSSARNGQMNLMVGAMMMLAMYAVSKKQWNLTALFLVLGFAYKPVAIVLLLLVFALYPATRWRIVLGVIVMFALPFLTAPANYVIEQYSAAFHTLTGVMDFGKKLTTWAQLFGMLSHFNIIVPPFIQDCIRLVMAVLTLAVCFIAKQKLDPKSAVIYIFTFAAIYLMLFNPRTENNSYAILAPAIGYFLAYQWLEKSNKWQAFLLGLIALGIAISYNITMLVSHVKGNWFSPLMAIVFLLLTLINLHKSCRS